MSNFMESFTSEVTYSRYLVAATDTADEKAKQEILNDGKWGYSEATTGPASH